MYITIDIDDTRDYCASHVRELVTNLLQQHTDLAVASVYVDGNYETEEEED